MRSSNASYVGSTAGVQPNHGVHLPLSSRARRAALVVAALICAVAASGCNADAPIDRAISEINSALSAFTSQSDAWRDAVAKLPNQFDGLESEASSDVKQVITSTGNDVRHLVDDAIELTDAKAQGLVAQAGVEFRCNADFVEAGVHAELLYLVKKLEFWKTHKTDSGDPPLAHNLCWVTPSVVSLHRVGDHWAVNSDTMAHKGVIDLYGYNFRPDALPTMQLTGLSDGTRDATITPAYVTSYQLGVDLSTETFNGVQAGSRLELTWPDNHEPTVITLTPRPEAHLELNNISVSPPTPTALQDSVIVHVTVTNTGGSTSDAFDVTWKPDPQDLHVWQASHKGLDPGTSANLSFGAHTYQNGGTITSNISLSNGDDTQTLTVTVAPPPHQPAPVKAFLEIEHTEHGNLVGGFGKDVDFGGPCDAGYVRSEVSNVIIKDSSGGAAISWRWTNDDPHSCQVKVHYSISPGNWITAGIHIKEKGV